jgi:hypothetical protein
MFENIIKGELHIVKKSHGMEDAINEFKIKRYFHTVMDFSEKFDSFQERFLLLFRSNSLIPFRYFVLDMDQNKIN